MNRHWSYLKYILRHKWYVFLACLKLGVPIWIAIFHDWDKFLPDEWFPYARFFYEPDGSKRTRRDTTGYYIPYDTGDQAFDFAWLLHQKRNKHHWQWWILPQDDGDTKIFPMQDVYRREMLSDWIGAGRALGKPKTWEWYAANKDNMKLHPDTRAWIEEQVARLEQEYSELERLKGIGVL